ncbi:hypothetical protein ACQJBY_031695 [Aegilops geniculata]
MPHTFLLPDNGSTRAPIPFIYSKMIQNLKKEVAIQDAEHRKRFRRFSMRGSPVAAPSAISRRSGSSPSTPTPAPTPLLPSRRSHNQWQGSMPAAAGAGTRREGGGRPGEEGRHRRVVYVQILLYPTRDRERDVWKEMGGTREGNEKLCHIRPVH